MDGISILRELRQALNEAATSTWPDVKTSYDFLYRAAIATADRINLSTTTQSITTVGDQRNYKLNADFRKLYLMDDQNRYFIKYNDGTYDYFLYMTSMDAIILANNGTSVDIPYDFCIRDASAGTQITGATTATGALASPYTIFGQTLGETTLTYATGGLTATVCVGDEVHNTTDGSHGYVIAVSSDTAVICALFDGTNNHFTLGDAFIINPQQRFELYLDPPPLTSAQTITNYYVQKPAPVYSAYRRYNLPIGNSDALVAYAAWLYKYRDREPSFGDQFYRIWDTSTRQVNRTINDAKQNNGYKVNLVKRASRSWTYR